ncbi:MAG: hypothetical protein JWM33_3039 [Caulobacteraceae bacterium]|nr:hypothetical protein [Caulobacteraceae bacterium]
MRTDDLIALLSADDRPVPAGAPTRRLGLAALAGGGLALLMVVFWLGLRPDLPQAVGGGFFWIKAAYTGSLAIVFGWASLKLSRPEAAPALPWRLGAAILLVFVGAGLAQAQSMDTPERLAALRGVSWTVCARNILILGAPLTLMTLAALRSLAPTKPTTAGLAAGLFAGGLAATLYGLHCPEATFVFVALWYSLGMALCGALGALVGRWWLRW